MKKRILLFIILLTGAMPLIGQSRFEKEWDEVESLVDRGLPQSALKIVDQVYAASRAENNMPQFLKASLYTLKLQSDYQEDYIERNIERIRVEMTGSQPPAKQILHSVLAELYWRYYQANRYFFMDRTSLAEPDALDIKTWDLPTLIEAVSANYRASLEEEDLLQATALGLFDPIIEEEKGSRHYRPTLYDFLAHRALDFFMHGEAGLIRPASTFQVDSPEYFLPAARFASLSLDPPGDGDFKRESLRILQGLIGFHLNDQDPAPLIDADLKRIRFVEENAVMPERFDLYLESLRNMEAAYAAYPNSTDIGYEIALEYLRRGAQYNPFLSAEYRWDFKNALETCEKAVSAFPGSDGARNCDILMADIRMHTLSFTLKYANLPEVPFLASLDFKNISKVHFRIIPMDPEEDRQLKQKQRNEILINRYRSVAPLKSWDLDLPDAGDFQGHNAQIRIPALPKGYYVILASDDPGFSVQDKIVAYASFWVTGISYISESFQDEAREEILVLDRQKGTPLKGATARAYVREYDYASRSYQNRPLDSYISDDSGRISITSPAGSQRTFYLEFNYGGDRFFTENYFYLYPPRAEEKTHDVTYFFTDRAVYRPGQTIYFKGIVLERTGEKSAVKTGFPTEVALFDVNGQKVSELLLTTNEFGSFNSVFVAPTGGLTGEMSIRNESGSISFAVEEYRRPKFKVEIDSLEGSYRLNESLTVTGKAMTYAGNAVDQASVKYRVVRSARFPVWRDWWYWFPNIPETEIISGQTETSPDGSFSLTFMAYPDLQVDPKFQPVFNYRIYVDVTDMTGEVRSAEETVSAGYQALLLDVGIPEKMNCRGSSRFRLTATNLNGRPVKAGGKMTIYPLEAPARLFRDRSWERPDVFVMTADEFRKEFPNEIYANENDPDTWKRSKAFFSLDFDSETDSVLNFGDISRWDAGKYMLILESADAFGQKVEVTKYFTVYNPEDDLLPENSPFWRAVLKNSGEPGDTAAFLVGTGEKNVKLLYIVENDRKAVYREWIDLSQEKRKISIPIREEYRGNFFVNFIFVRENRSYQVTEKVSVPFTDRELKFSTETFRSKLTPGQDEEWRIRITGSNGEKVAAELLASMYDASLDAFREHNWNFLLYPYRHSSLNWNTRNAFGEANSQVVRIVPPADKTPVIRNYDRLNWFGFNYYGGPQPRWVGGNQLQMKNMDAMTTGIAADKGTQAEEPVPLPGQEISPISGKEAEKQVEVPVRRNFAETAFFFPTLMTDENGEVLLKFSVPESLTAWKLMMLAYTKDLKTGQLEKEVVTQKDLMVMPNPPRFFREGDRVAFSAKVVSLAREPLQGQVTAEFFDAFTMRPLDSILGNIRGRQDFGIEKGISGLYNWEILIPEGLEAIVCRIQAVSGSMSDGEEVMIPVLPNRMLVTETLPLPVNGRTTKNFTFEKLIDSERSATLKNYRLTLEFTSNPAWYAVQALPYLLESPHESADNIFSRYYANSIAAYIANSDPRIRQVFESWKNLSPDALLSGLEKNQELKAVILSETPWVMQARNETERKKRIAVLFDLNRMADEERTTLNTLRQMQLPNGGWPWFPGMPDSRYITQAVVSGIGKLHHLGIVDLDKDQELTGMVRRAVYYLDDRIREDYEDIKAVPDVDISTNHLSATQVHYLYARSFIGDLAEVTPASSEAFEYFKGQAQKFWLQQDKFLQGMIALSLFRYGVSDVPVDILNSLRENALYDEEMGLYWRDPGGYYWHEAPVERQALMIEAFSEVGGDQGAVEQLKVWLLKQKQTQDWKTNRATADAIYALLLKGTDLLAGDQLVEVTVGTEKIDPLTLDGTKVEAGTGYFQTSWRGSEIIPAMGEITVTKKDEGTAWGAMYWQYYEHLDRITPARSPLNVEKILFLERNTATGPVLDQVQDTTVLKTGDKVKVRVIIRTDRDLEFVHMKDMRAAAFEPVRVLSGYRYQSGMGYYESIRDASVNFYFDYLRKGTYVFEYPLNVTQKGEYSNGITSIQCLYAPEFAAHSQGDRVKVE